MLRVMNNRSFDRPFPSEIRKGIAEAEEAKGFYGAYLILFSAAFLGSISTAWLCYMEHPTTTIAMVVVGIPSGIFAYIALCSYHKNISILRHYTSIGFTTSEGRGYR